MIRRKRERERMLYFVANSSLIYRPRDVVRRHIVWDNFVWGLFFCLGIKESYEYDLALVRFVLFQWF